MAGAVVVGVAVPGVVVPEFGAELNGRTDPVGPGEGFFGVAGLVGGALGLFVVEEVGAEREEVVGVALVLEEVDGGVLGGGAAGEAGVAGGGVGALEGGDGSGGGGDVALVHEVGFRCHVDGFRELVVPGGVVLLEVVVGVFGGVDAVGADVDVVIDGLGGVVEAGGSGGFGSFLPGGDVVAGGDASLDEPLVAELDGGEDADVGEGVDGVEEGVGEGVVVGGELGFDAGDGDVSADADVHALSDFGEVEIEVFEGWVEAVGVVVVEELGGEDAFGGGEVVVGAEEGGEVEAVVEVGLLDGVGEALGVDDELVEFEAVGDGVVGGGEVGGAGGAEVEGGFEPAVELEAGFGSVDGGHEGVGLGIGLAEGGSAAVAPVGGGERGGVEGRGKASAGWAFGGGGGSVGPVLAVELGEAVGEVWGFGGLGEGGRQEGGQEKDCEGAVHEGISCARLLDACERRVSFDCLRGGTCNSVKMQSYVLWTPVHEQHFSQFADKEPLQDP